MSSIAYAILFNVCLLTAPSADPATHTFSKCHIEQKVMKIEDPEQEGFSDETDRRCVYAMLARARMANMLPQMELMQRIQTGEWPVEIEVIKEGQCKRLTDA